MLRTTSTSGVVAAGRDSILMRDRDRLAPGATPVIYCHHATGTARTPLPGAAWSVGTETDRALAVMAERLTVLGHPVGTSDQGGPTSWNNDAAQAEVTALLAQLATEYGANPNRVLLLGDSMGSQLALSWAKANPAKVAAVAVLLPIPDLRYVYANPGGNDFKTPIDAAYGGAAAYAAAEPGRNAARTPAAFKDMHVRLWYSSDDVVGLPAESTDFVAEVQSAGGAGSIASASIGAVGHTIPLAFDGNAVTDFLHAHA